MARIAIFDSGVGGLSILDALQQHAAAHHLTHEWVFCSDNAFFPYGTRDPATLTSRVQQVVQALDHACQPDVIVIACNTASTIALQAVREHIDTAVVGVVPAIKPAAALSNTRVIGLLATPATVQRPYTNELIQQFAPDCTVIRVGSSELVQLAEDYLRTGTLDTTILHTVLTPLQTAITQQGLDTVVLACTHFPLLVSALRQQLPNVKHWVDSGEAIARRVDWCLQQKPINTSQSAVHRAWFTRDDSSLPALKPALARYGLERVAILPVPHSRASESSTAQPE